jgi:hypothetical protein
MESASTELSNILEELFDLSGEELADVTVLVEQLGTLGLQSVADEISALRESLHLRLALLSPTQAASMTHLLQRRSTLMAW